MGYHIYREGKSAQISRSRACAVRFKFHSRRKSDSSLRYKSSSDGEARCSTDCSCQSSASSDQFRAIDTSCNFRLQSKRLSFHP